MTSCAPPRCRSARARRSTARSAWCWAIREREFEERDLALLECAAEAAGTSLEQEAADRRAAGAAEATVTVLSELAELRDGYVAADAEEVARLASAIGERLGISGALLAALFAARVHDIGKIGVPDHILHKERHARRRGAHA